MKPHLLVVEDDEFVQSLLAAYMKKEGFRVSVAATGTETLGLLNGGLIDLVLLDLTLPDEDGLTLARQVRARSKTPIIVLTARKGRDDRITALEVGADDYLNKPVDPEELVLRIRNLLGRSDGEGTAVNTRRRQSVEFADFILDVAGHTLSRKGGEAIPLTNAEFNLLSALVNAPNRVLSRAVLLDAISQDEAGPSERVIDVLISRLRKKIEADARRPTIILTVVGSGYRFGVEPR